jgi:hypothetical protein
MAALTDFQKCDAGYFCSENGKSNIPNPPTTEAPDPPNPMGGKCSKGHYCPTGSFEETDCVAGTYEPRDGSAECQECPVGYYCETGSFIPKECESGYCPAGSAAPLKCGAGTYGSETLKKLEKAEDCPFCPNGMYCRGGSNPANPADTTWLGIIDGTCDAGFWCDFGATAFRDGDKVCEAGHYCPAGTALPVRCPETLYFAGTGATDVSFCQPCQAGYYCLDNDSVSRVCPKGHFCQEKTKEPIPCFEGTYNPYKR